MSTEALAEMTGLKQLQVLLKSGPPPSIDVTLKFDAVEFDDGFAVFERCSIVVAKLDKETESRSISDSERPFSAAC